MSATWTLLWAQEQRRGILYGFTVGGRGYVHEALVRYGPLFDRRARRKIQRLADRIEATYAERVRVTW